MGLLNRLLGKKDDEKEEDIKDTQPEPQKPVQTKPSDFKKQDPLDVGRPVPKKTEPKPAPKAAPKPAAPKKETAKEPLTPKPVSKFVPPAPEKKAEPERKTIPQPSRIEKRPEPEKKAEPPQEKKHVPKPIPPYKGPVTKPPVSEAGSVTDKTEEMGIIYGNVGTSTFSCRVTAHMEKSEYIMAEHDDCGPVLCQVGSLIRKTDLTVEKTLNMDGNTDIQEIISAQIDVVGYRDDRGLLQIPRTTFRAGKPVYKANDALIQSVLGLKMKEKTGAYIGL
jgi:hypothetical protein